MEIVEDRWKRLVALLEPIHAQAIATARRLCRSAADADDLYQEAVLRAFEKLDALRDPVAFRSWFYAIVLSRHRSRSRTGFWKRFRPWEPELGVDSSPVGEEGRDWDERRSRAARAARALQTLAAEQREAVVLFEIDGYSIEEIADMQRTSISAVKSRLARGRERLRRWYEARGFGPHAPAVHEEPAGKPRPARRRADRMAPRPTEELCDD